MRPRSWEQPSQRFALTEVLAAHTTLRVGGPANRFEVATTSERLIEIVSECDHGGKPVLVLGGGSNLLVSDDGFPGTVVRVQTRGVEVFEGADGGVTVTVAAGEPWDDFVAHAVAKGWVGVEALSGIPGLAGATPIQNVGAYGQEVADTLARVQVYDRHDHDTYTLEAGACRFSYRNSLFKSVPGRYVVLAVTFAFGVGELSVPIRFGELSRRLGLEPDGRAPLADVRSAVLELRRGKGMVLDPDDHDTWSAGSFFTNPILEPDVAATLPEDAPRFPGPDGTVKTSAAWLIAHSGFSRGHGTPPATLSTKHTLALTNRGGATAADIVDLAREVRAGVEAEFGVTLVPEPVLVGLSL